MISIRLAKPVCVSNAKARYVFMINLWRFRED